MKGITVLRRLTLLRGVALLVIVLAGLIANLGSPPAAKAASCTLSCYPGVDTINLTNPNNGSVMHDPHVFLIFEGTWAASDTQAVNQYFTDVNGSAFEGILTQYYDPSGHISNTLKFSGSVMDPSFIHSDGCGTKTIVDNGLLGDISAEIGQEVASRDSSTIYFVFTPPGYKVYDSNNTSCNHDSCGFHAWYPGLPSLIYAVIPYGGGPCGGQDPGTTSEFPPGAAPVLIDINTASHEQFEAITDPFGGAWISGKNEIGDKCGNRHPGIALSFGIYPLMQGEYSNASQICEYPAMPYPVCDSSSSETQSLACDASIPNGNFNTLWLQMGGPLGSLSNPIDSWYSVNGGQTQDFGGGSIYWSSATGTDEVQGAIYNEYTSVWGGPTGVLGFPTTNELGIAAGRVSYFYGNLCGGRGPNNSGAAIYYSGTTGAHQVGGCIYNKYWNMGGPNSQLNFPTSDVLAISGGYVSYFFGVRCGGTANGPNNSGSAIYSGGPGTFYVQGCIYAAYQRLGAATTNLGYPVSDENTLYNSSGSRIGWASYFQGYQCGTSNPYASGGAIFVPASNNTASAGHDVKGCLFTAYERLGGPNSALGFPVSDETQLYNSGGTLIGWASYFAGQYCGSGGPNGSGSAIYVPASNNSPGGGHEVQGCIYNEYQHMGGPNGMGFPTTDEQNVYNSSGAVSGRENLFNGAGCNGTGSAILWSGITGAHEVHGCIYNTYVNFGGPASSLGLPTTDEYTNSSGQRESDFAGGNIVWWNGHAYITLYAGH